MNWQLEVKNKKHAKMSFEDASELQNKLLKDGVSSFIWRIK